MRKKIAFALSMILMMLMLGACGTDPTTVDYNGVSYDQLLANTCGTVESLTTLPEEYIDYYLNSEDEFTRVLVEAWIANTEGVGDYVGLLPETFAIDKSGSTLTTTVRVDFTVRDVDFQMVFNYYDMSMPTGVTGEPVYTLGEKMSKAGMNTLISMGIVFCVLILISLIIYCFKFLNVFEVNKKKKAQAAQAAKETAAQDNVVTQIEQREVQQTTDDTELVAVIAAAIAASTGTSTSDFVVRSINRR